MRAIMLLLMLISQLIIGQNIELISLDNQLNAENNPSRKLEFINKIVGVAFQSNTKQALAYAKQGVAIAVKSNDKNWQPKFYEMQGRMHANLLQLDFATIFFNKAEKGYIAVNDKQGQAKTYFKMAWIHRKKGEFEKAISIASKNNLNSEKFFVNFNAGNVAMSSLKFQESFNYYDRALTIAKEQNMGLPSLADFTNSRENAYKKLEKYDLALKDYQTCLKYAKASNYQNAINAVSANLGEVNLLLGNYMEALICQLETVRLQESDNESSNLVEYYHHLSTIYSKIGDYKSALTYKQKAYNLRDTIASVESDAKISELLTKYETKKKEETISTQETKISQQKLIQHLFIGLATLLLGLLIFGYISYKSRNKKNKLLAIKNAENELLLKEIHHRVKNNLEVVSGLLELQSSQVKEQSTKDAIQESQNRVNSIGIVHQKLYQGTNLGAIEMKDYVLNLSESILDSFGAEEKITLELAMENFDLDIDTAIPLGLIINELITNTIKYAFPNNQKGKLVIKLEKQHDTILHLVVSDNGVGKSGITHGTGFGGQLISLLTQQLNGTMIEENQNGTTVIFDFKLKKEA
jgi:two-component sensor histidine kinase